MKKRRKKKSTPKQSKPIATPERYFMTPDEVLFTLNGKRRSTTEEEDMRHANCRGSIDHEDC